MIDPASIDLPRFMAAWRAEPDAPASELPAEYRWLPQPLKDWYELTSRWTSPYTQLKQMRAPQEIKATGKAVEFMTDPNGDWIWAFDLDEPHIVYDRELYEPWTRTSEDLPEFMVHHALNEAFWIAEVNQHAHVPDELLPAALEGLTEVGFGGWQWPGPGVRVFLGEHSVAEVTPLNQSTLRQQAGPWLFEVQIASSEPGGLDHLDALADVRWFKSGSGG